MALPRNESDTGRLLHAQATIMGFVASGRLFGAADRTVQLLEHSPAETNSHFTIGAAFMR